MRMHNTARERGDLREWRSKVWAYLLSVRDLAKSIAVSVWICQCVVATGPPWAAKPVSVGSAAAQTSTDARTFVYQIVF